MQIGHEHGNIRCIVLLRKRGHLPFDPTGDHRRDPPVADLQVVQIRALVSPGIVSMAMRTTVQEKFPAMRNLLRLRDVQLSQGSRCDGQFVRHPGGTLPQYRRQTKCTAQREHTGQRCCDQRIVHPVYHGRCCSISPPKYPEALIKPTASTNTPT